MPAQACTAIRTSFLCQKEDYGEPSPHDSDRLSTGESELCCNGKGNPGAMVGSIPVPVSSPVVLEIGLPDPCYRHFHRRENEITGGKSNAMNPCYARDPGSSARGVYGKHSGLKRDV
jgi:hypothetical protein